jgi:hypothetical protein
MIQWLQKFRAYSFPIFSTILVFICAQIAFFKEQSELHRLGHGTAIVWCCEALFLLGMTSCIAGIYLSVGNRRVHPLFTAPGYISIGVLVMFLSFVVQFDVWQTIGKYSMFYALHHLANL